MQLLTFDLQRLPRILWQSRNELTHTVLRLNILGHNSVQHFVGGCGACVVLVSRYDPRTKKVEELTVNSCLMLLCSLDGCAVTTTEGLGNQQAGHHAIHKRMSGFHASQCGFCTPGMTMALYGTLRKSVAKSRNGTEAANGSANGAANGSADGAADGAGNLHLTAVEAEQAIAGNLCRCTGYRPLLDTCKSFCGEVDVEDLGLRRFPNKNELPPYDATHDPVFPPFLIGECEACESYSHDNGSISALSMALSLHRLCHSFFQ